MPSENGITSVEGAMQRCYYDDAQCRGFVFNQAESKAYFVRGIVGEHIDSTDTAYFEII